MKNFPIILPKSIALIVAILVLLFADPALIADHYDKIMELQLTPIIQKADSLYSLGNINAALDIYEAVLQVSREGAVSSKILYQISDCYKKLGMYTMAVTALDTLLKDYPQRVEELNMDYQLGSLSFMAQKYEKAQKYLSLYLNGNPDEENKGKVEFQLAYSHQQNKNYEAAIKFYRKAIDDLPLLSDYALYYMAQCYHQLGDCSSSFTLFDRIKNEYSNSPLNLNIEGEIADCYYDNEFYEEAADSYLGMTKGNLKKVSDFEKADIYFQLAKSYQKGGKLNQADKTYRKIVDKFPKTSYAYESAKILEDLAVRLTWENYFSFAQICYNNGYYHQAIHRFRDFIAKYPKNKKADSAQYWIGRSYDRARERTKAIREYELLLQKYPRSDLRVQAKKQIAECYRKKGDDDMALIKYDEFIRTYPKEKGSVDDSYYEIGRIYERKNNFEQAIEKYQYLLKKRNPSKKYREYALWRLVQVNYQLGNFDESIQAAKTFLKSYNSDSESAKVSYWVGKNYLAKKDITYAFHHFLETVKNFPDSYYGRRAKEQIDQNVWSNLSSIAVPVIPEAQQIKEKKEILAALKLNNDAYENLSDDIFWQKGKMLVELGFFEDGYSELRHVEKNNYKDLSVVLELAYLYSQSKRYDRAARCALTLSRHMEEPYPIGLQRFLYPVCYPEIVRENSAKHGIDPLFVCALIKQESWFNPDATSWAGAMGLMQVIPPTAREIATDLAIENFSQEKLYDPHWSIKFGTYYIVKQLRAFDNHMEPALAAYNGGPGNSKRWLNGNDDMDEFVEDIEFKETRNYVKIVMNNYWKYLEIWRNDMSN